MTLVVPLALILLTVGLLGLLRRAGVDSARDEEHHAGTEFRKTGPRVERLDDVGEDVGVSFEWSRLDDLQLNRFLDEHCD